MNDTGNFNNMDDTGNFNKIGIYNLHKISEYLRRENDLQKNIKKMNEFGEYPEFLNIVKDDKLKRDKEEFNIITNDNVYDYIQIKASFLEYKKNKEIKGKKFDEGVISVINSIEEDLNFLADYYNNPIEFNYPLISNLIINFFTLSYYISFPYLFFGFFYYLFVFLTLTLNLSERINKEEYYGYIIETLIVIFGNIFSWWFVYFFLFNFLKKILFINYITKKIKSFLKDMYNENIYDDLKSEKIMDMYNYGIIKHNTWGLK